MVESTALPQVTGHRHWNYSWFHWKEANRTIRAIASSLRRDEHGNWGRFSFLVTWGNAVAGLCSISTSVKTRQAIVCGEGITIGWWRYMDQASVPLQALTSTKTCNSVRAKIKAEIRWWIDSSSKGGKKNKQTGSLIHVQLAKNLYMGCVHVGSIISADSLWVS